MSYINLAICPDGAIKARERTKQNVFKKREIKNNDDLLYDGSFRIWYRKGISIEKEKQNDLAASPAINGEKGQALLLKLCRSRVIISTVSCQWVSTHTILLIEQVRFALPVHD